MERKAQAKWDKENTAILSCKARKDIAEAFKAYCKAQGKTVHAVLLEYVTACIEKGPGK